MAKSTRSFPALFVVALILSVAAAAATPTLDCVCHNETVGLSVIGHADAASNNDLPVGARRLLPGLESVAGRVPRAAGVYHAVPGDRVHAMLVPPPTRFSMPTSGRVWTDDPRVLTQASPRGPPSV
jgi:hypothetical protein